MKNSYKLFIGVIIGILLSSTCVYAANLIAKDISYTPNNDKWQVDNVEDAIDSLYNSNNNFVYLNNYQILEVLPANFNGVYLKPTMTVNNNTATVNCQGTSVMNNQGGIYLKIDNIEEYKYLVVAITASSRTLAVGISDNIDDKFSFIKSQNIISYTSDTEQRKSNVKTYIDVSDLSGTKYLVLAGTHYNCDISVKAYQY